MKSFIKLSIALVLLVCTLLSVCSCGFLAFTTGTMIAAATPVEEKEGTEEYVTTAKQIPEEIASNIESAIMLNRIKKNNYKSVEKIGTVFLLLKDKVPTNSADGIAHSGIYGVDPYDNTFDNYSEGFPVNLYLIIYKLTPKKSSGAGKETVYEAYGVGNIKKDQLTETFNYNRVSHYLDNHVYYVYDVFMSQIIGENSFFFDIECDAPGYERSFEPRTGVKYLQRSEVRGVYSASEFGEDVREFLKSSVVNDLHNVYYFDKNVTVTVEKEYLLIPLSKSEGYPNPFTIYGMYVKVTGKSSKSGETFENIYHRTARIARTETKTILKGFNIAASYSTIKDTVEDAYEKLKLSKNTSYEIVGLD